MKTCQKPYKFDLEVKVQVRIWIMNVRDTSSNGAKPISKYGRPMLNHLKVRSRGV